MVSSAGAIGFLLVSIYCLVQAVRDFRRGAYVMAALGVACALLLWLIPIETRAVKYDILP